VNGKEGAGGKKELGGKKKKMKQKNQDHVNRKVLTDKRL